MRSEISWDYGLRHGAMLRMVVDASHQGVALCAGTWIASGGVY